MRNLATERRSGLRPGALGGARAHFFDGRLRVLADNPYEALDVDHVRGAEIGDLAFRDLREVEQGLVDGRRGLRRIREPEAVADALRVVARDLRLEEHVQVGPPKVPVERGLTAERLREEHTLEPYYRATLVKDRSAQTKSGSGGKERRPNRTAGMAGYYLAPTHLRFCAECVREQIDNAGEAYWRREHQLPAALLCLEHDLVLRNSNVEISHLRRHVLADKESCPDSSAEVVIGVSATQKRRLADLARQSEKLLRSGKSNPIAYKPWRRRVLNICIEKKLRFHGGYVKDCRIDRIVEEQFGFLRSIWPRTFGHRTNIWFSCPSRLEQRIGYVHHVTSFIVGHVLNRYGEAVDHPFGSGPWPCLNTLCSGFEKKVVVNLEWQKLNGGRYAGELLCRCGCRYVEFLQQDGDTGGATRILAYGPRVDLYVRWACDNGFSLSAAAKLASLPAVVVKEAVIRNGLMRAWDGAVSPCGRKEVGNLLRSFRSYADKVSGLSSDRASHDDEGTQGM